MLLMALLSSLTRVSTERGDRWKMLVPKFFIDVDQRKLRCKNGRYVATVVAVVVDVVVVVVVVVV